ncbi:hypothetical protein GCM10028784_13890 [Myceligenerans cantabricum]
MRREDGRVDPAVGGGVHAEGRHVATVPGGLLERPDDGAWSGVAGHTLRGGLDGTVRCPVSLVLRF